MEAMRFSNMSVLRRGHIPKHGILRTHRRESLKPYKGLEKPMRRARKQVGYS
jgi:hypothetical protein